MTARKTASLAGFAPPPAGEAAEPKILSCSTNLYYSKPRRLLQGLRGISFFLFAFPFGGKVAEGRMRGGVPVIDRERVVSASPPLISHLR